MSTNKKADKVLDCRGKLCPEPVLETKKNIKSIEMVEKLNNYTFNIPEEFIGEIMGEVSKRGGWLNEQDNENENVTFSVKIAAENMLGFEEWFKKVTGHDN